ncbi:MAG: hypothetical protein ACRCVI_02595 [Mycoplasmoidaceae bacterium]
MNKKNKVGVLGALLLGTSLSVILPIVSCSNNENPNYELSVTKGTEAQKQAISYALAKIADPTWIPSTGSDAKLPTLTKVQFEKITKTFSKKDETVWAAAREYFSFLDNNSVYKVGFDNVVKDLSVTGEYVRPGTAGGTNLSVKIKLNMDEKYQIKTASDLEQTLIVGFSANTEVAISVAAENKAAIATALANFAYAEDSSATTPFISKSQFDLIKDTIFKSSSRDNALWEALGKYFSFKIAGTSTEINFTSVADQLIVLDTSTYPTEYNKDVKVSLQLKLKPGFFSSGTVSLIITDLVIGQSSEKLALSGAISEANKNAVELALAKIGNDAFNDNQQFMSSAELNNITSSTYNSSSTAVWAALGSFFNFSENLKAVTFNQVAKSATVTATYPTSDLSQNITVSLVLELNEGYTISNGGILTQAFIVGKSINKVTTTPGNDEAKNAVAIALAKLADKTTNDAFLEQTDFDKIIAGAATNVEVKTALSSYLTFKAGETDLLFDDVLSPFTVTGELPTEAASTDINVTITSTFKNGYLEKGTDSTTISQTYTVGKTFNTTSVELVDTNKNAVGTAFAKFANGATTNDAAMSQTDFEKLTSTPFNVTDHSDIWTALGNYFTFKTGTQTSAFNDVIASIAVTGNYLVGEVGSNLEIEVSLTPNSAYKIVAANQPDLTQKFLVGKTDAILVVTNNESASITVGAAFASIAKETTITDITQPLSKTEFDKIPATVTLLENETVWNALGEYFTFTLHGQPKTFNNVVDSVAVTKEYPTTGTLGTDLTVSVSLTLKPEYTSDDSNKLIKTFKVGVTDNVVTVTQEETNAEAVGIAFANLAKKGSTTNTGALTKAEFENIPTTIFLDSPVVEQLGNYFTFTLHGQTKTFAEVVQSISVTREYPTTGTTGTELNVTVTLTLKTEYAADDNNKLIGTFKVGVTDNVVTVAPGTTEQLNAIGTALASYAKETAAEVNTGPLSQLEYERIPETATSTSEHGLWAAIEAYFSLSLHEQDKSLSDVVKSVAITKVDYPTTPAADQILNATITLTLNDGLVASDPTLLSKDVQVGVTDKVLSLTKDTSTTALDSVGLLFAKKANTALENTTSPISTIDFANILDGTYNKDLEGEIWTALANVFKFTWNGNPIGFNDVINTVAVTKADYPTGTPGEKLTVSVVLGLVPEYSGPTTEQLTQSFDVGISDAILTVTKKDFAPLKNEIGTAFAQFLNADSTSTFESQISKVNFDKLETTTFNGTQAAIWTALGNYFEFNLHGEPKSFSEVIAGITISENVYPPATPNAPLNITITLTPKSSYTFATDSSITETLQIGISTNLLEVLKSPDESIKNGVGTIFAQIGNKDATTNSGVLTSVQYATIKSADYSKANTAIWTELAKYYLIKFNNNPLDFDIAIGSITVTAEAYPIGASIPLYVTVKLNPSEGYSFEESEIIDQFKIGVSTETTVEITTNPVPGGKEDVAIEIRKQAGVSNNTTDDYISKSNSDRLHNKTLAFTDLEPQLKTRLDSYIIFNIAPVSTKIDIIARNLIKDVKFEINYPELDRGDVMANLTFILNPGFVVSDESTLVHKNFKIGISYPTISISSIDDTNKKTTLENLLAGINEGNDINSVITQEQWQNIRNIGSTDFMRSSQIQTAFLEYITFVGTTINGGNINDYFQYISLAGDFINTDKDGYLTLQPRFVVKPDSGIYIQSELPNTVKPLRVGRLIPLIE